MQNVEGKGTLYGKRDTYMYGLMKTSSLKQGRECGLTFHRQGTANIILPWNVTR